MYVLQSFPTATAIAPEEFIQGSRAELEDVTRRFCEQYNSDVGVDYAREWEDFRDNIAPQSDSVQEWVKDHPLHIPFHDTLVRGAPLRITTDPGDALRERTLTCAHNRPRKSKPLDYVTWSRRGQSKIPSNPSSKFPNVVVEGPPDVERYSVPVHCKKSKHADRHLSTSGIRLPPISRKDISIVPTEMTLAEAESEILSSTTGADFNSGDASSSEASSGSDTDSTDSDVEVNDWVTCHGPHHIPRYYCARDCVGNTFTVPEKLLVKAPFGDKCPTGKVHSIVRKAGADSNDVYFKFYNHVKYPDEPPPEDSDDYCYVPCTTFMSSDVNKRKMNWDKSYRQTAQTKAPRQKKKIWAYEPKKRALFDDGSDEETDEVLRKPRKLRSGRTLDRKDDTAEEEGAALNSADPSDTDTPPVSVPSSRRQRRSHSSVVSLPPVHVQREDLRQRLVNKGILQDRPAKDEEEDVELSECTSSSSESEND